MSDTSNTIDTLGTRLRAAGAFEATLTGPRGAAQDGVTRVDARVIEVKGVLCLQINRRTATQSFHENAPLGDGVAALLALLPSFRQGVFTLPDARLHALTNRRGEVAVREQRGAFGVAAAAHDQKKARVLETHGWQRALGLVSAAGTPAPGMGDKLRQMDRFARIVSEALARVKGPFEVIDLCCGKGYLTFAVAQLLRQAGLDDVRVKGIDLKGGVIEKLGVAAREAGFEHLTFEHGDIARCAPPALPPLVVSLHACDTATDVALAQAVRWGAPVILCAPCCQHELRPQIRSAVLEPLLKHGLFRERYAALLTDALRCALLERHGYSVDVLEFIDPEHTPKNTLIRAVRTGTPCDDGAYVALRDAMGVTPALERLLEGE